MEVIRVQFTQFLSASFDYLFVFIETSSLNPSLVHRLMRFGLSFTNALAKVRERTFAELSAVLRSEYLLTDTERQSLSRLLAHAYSSKFDERVKLLSELRANRFALR